MSQKETLRSAANKIYREQSLSISDSFELEELKKIGVILVPSDAPSWVNEIAEFIRKQVCRKYEVGIPVIQKTFPVFEHRSHTENDLDAIYKILTSSEKSDCSVNGKTLFLCDTLSGARLLEIYNNAAKQLGENHCTPLLLDVEAFRRCRSKALEYIARKMDVPDEMLEKYAPYRRKVYCCVDYMVVYASGFESWPDLVHAWHANRQVYHNTPRIIYVDDLQKWTSSAYSAKIFHRFSKLLKRMKIKNVPITVVSDTAPELVMEIIGFKSAIIFIPQLKTYYCGLFRDKFSAGRITFDICEKSFEEYWCSAGAIARQLFCQELLKFLENWKQETYELYGYDFRRLFKPRRFKDWNMKFYWWNYKIRLRSFCTQAFLSEFGTYR